MKSTFKKHAGNTNTAQIDKSEEEHYMVKISEKKHKKIDFYEELEKQYHLNNAQKQKLLQLWKNNEDLIKGKVGHYNKTKVKLWFKQGASKSNNYKLCAVADTHEKLMKDFLEDSCEQKVLRKVDLEELMIPVFCQGKSGGGIRLSTDLRKLNERLERNVYGRSMSLIT